MKKIIFCFTLIFVTVTMNAQDIQLPEPNFKQSCKTVIEALQTRHSVRSFSEKELTLEELSTLCWAACGLTRDGEHITAPSALNRQEIRLFVFTKEGVYEYLAQKNLLLHIASGDHRALVAGTSERSQDFVLEAPLSLVMVMDFDKFALPAEDAISMMAVDAGNVSENINLYCEAVGLATVPRASMDKKGIQKLLNLNDNQIPIMNNPVGYER